MQLFLRERTDRDLLLRIVFILREGTAGVGSPDRRETHVVLQCTSAPGG